MQIKFLGATRHVTGSNYLITLDNGDQYLVDCGMFQGSHVLEDMNAQPFSYDPADIKTLLITHAHLDHTGRIPKLIKEGFTGEIVATHATRDLTQIVLEDTVRLMDEEAERENTVPLYDASDVAGIFNLDWHFVEYDREVTIGTGVTARYWDAGHILGSASIQIRADGQTVTFSGDIGNPPAPLIDKPRPVDATDILVIESTYGGRIHEPPEKRVTQLHDAIVDTLSRGGTLMIPTFAIERAQELIYEINGLIASHHIPNIPVYLDSPMAIKATRVFKHYAVLYNRTDKQRALHEDILTFPGLTLTQTVQASKQINPVKGPKIIMAGAGMMHGGRILHHAIRYLPDDRSMLLIVGYQVEGSIGRRLLDGEKSVKIHGDIVSVHARVKAIGAYSAHADQPGLLHYIDSIAGKPNTIYITHGEYDQQQILAGKITDQFGISTVIPAFGEMFDNKKPASY